MPLCISHIVVQTYWSNCNEVKICEIYVSNSHAAGDSGLLGCDAVSLDEWSPLNQQDKKSHSTRPKSSTSSLSKPQIAHRFIELTMHNFWKAVASLISISTLATVSPTSVISHTVFKWLSKLIWNKQRVAQIIVFCNVMSYRFVDRYKHFTVCAISGILTAVFVKTRGFWNDILCKLIVTNVWEEYSASIFRVKEPWALVTITS
jgi:hypothetical protein